MIPAYAAFLVPRLSALVFLHPVANTFFLSVSPCTRNPVNFFLWNFLAPSTTHLPFRLFSFLTGADKLSNQTSCSFHSPSSDHQIFVCSLPAAWFIHLLFSSLEVRAFPTQAIKRVLTTFAPSFSESLVLIFYSHVPASRLGSRPQTIFAMNFPLFSAEQSDFWRLLREFYDLLLYWGGSRGKRAVKLPPSASASPQIKRFFF